MISLFTGKTGEFQEFLSLGTIPQRGVRGASSPKVHDANLTFRAHGLPFFGLLAS